MKWNYMSRNRPTYIWTFDFWQSYKGNSVEKGSSFQRIMIEQLDSYLQKDKL